VTTFDWLNVTSRGSDAEVSDPIVIRPALSDGPPLMEVPVALTPETASAVSTSTSRPAVVNGNDGVPGVVGVLGAAGLPPQALPHTAAAQRHAAHR
jgi:hypothetical protein